jgi:fructose/tagatose bisphosphate aldolase
VEAAVEVAVEAEVEVEAEVGVVGEAFLQEDNQQGASHPTHRPFLA